LRVALAAIPDCVCKVNVGSAVPGVSERNMAVTGKKNRRGTMALKMAAELWGLKQMDK